MSNNTSKFIESLECRKLLAAQPAGVAPIEVVNPNLFGGNAVVEQSQQKVAKAEARAARKAAKQAAKKKADPVVRSTDLVGEWTGDVKVRFVFFSEKFDIDLSIYRQNENSISGRVEIEGYDFSGTLYGKINPKNGRFKYELQDDDDDKELTIRGQLGKHGQVIGGGKVKAEYGSWDVKGSFEVDRIG